jgi:hypothetical protein
MCEQFGIEPRLTKPRTACIDGMVELQSRNKHIGYAAIEALNHAIGTRRSGLGQTALNTQLSAHLIKTNMVRLVGRSPKGQRPRAGIPYEHWKTTTFVAALRLTGMMASTVLDGPINRAAFQA